MTERLKSVDFVRGLAIVFMIQTHIWEYCIARPNELGSCLYHGLVELLGGYAAPLFTLVSGLSTYFAIQSYGRPMPWDLAPKLLKRGGALFLLSTAVINVAAGPVLKVFNISILNWSVIQLIGFCLCLVPVYARLRWSFRLLWTAIPLILSEWLYSTDGSFSVFFAGFSPPFPRSFLFFTGMLVGECYAFVLQTGFSSKTTSVALAGVLLVGLAGHGLNIAYQPLTWNHMAHASITFMIVFAGCFVPLVGVFGYLLDYRRFEHRLVDITVGWGQHSLTIYYLQLIGIVVGAALIRSILGYPLVLEWIWFLPLLTLVLFVFHIIINVIWPKCGYAPSLEWCFARCMNGNRRTGRT
jgi:hypothetical protein